MSSYKLEKISERSNHSGPVYHLTLGPKSGTCYSSSGDGFVALWRAPGLEQEHEAVRIGEPVYCSRYVPSLNWLLAGTSSGSIHVIDRESRRELFNKQVHPGGVFDLLPVGEEELLIAAGADGTLSVWQLPSMELMVQLPICEGKIRRLVAVQGTTEFVAACGDGTIRWMETTFFNETKRLVCGKEGVTALAFHPHKPVLLAGDKSAMMHAWNLQTDSLLLSIPAHNFTIYDISPHPQLPLLATASRDKTIKLWSSSDLAVIDRKGPGEGGHTHSVNRLLWIDGETLISCGDDRKIIAWKLRS
ncbi:MAG: hypothetical protein JNM00_04465 [Flavobacteriales bacterium]|nr:hypothetical protein [Flavobacteriales bacterium]